MSGPELVDRDREGFDAGQDERHGPTRFDDREHAVGELVAGELAGGQVHFEIVV